MRIVQVSAYCDSLPLLFIVVLHLLLAFYCCLLHALIW